MHHPWFQVLHEQDSGGFVVDSHRALQFAIDVAKGMAYLHSLDRNMPRFHLNSKHVMVSSKKNIAYPGFFFSVHFLSSTSSVTHYSTIVKIALSCQLSDIECTRDGNFSIHLLQIDCISDEELCARVNMADCRFSFQVVIALSM